MFCPTPALPLYYSLSPSAHLLLDCLHTPLKGSKACASGSKNQHYIWKQSRHQEQYFLLVMPQTAWSSKGAVLPSGKWSGLTAWESWDPAPNLVFCFSAGICKALHFTHYKYECRLFFNRTKSSPRNTMLPLVKCVSDGKFKIGSIVPKRDFSLCCNYAS